jgi:hypothetical protein
MAQAGEQITNPVAGLSLRFVQTSADTNGELLEMEATYEPRSLEPVVHFHPRQSERSRSSRGHCGRGSAAPSAC